jgi:hypothetical protein
MERNMGLSDVVSGSGTTSFAQVGFVVSFVVFILIVIWTLLRPKEVMLAVARSALSDGLIDGQVNNERERCHGQQ